MMQSGFEKNSFTQRGYTLIETAIVISVVGMLMASMATAYSLYQKTQTQKVTVENTSQVISALGNFLVQNGRYPCPAPMDVGRDDPMYGMETDCTDVATVAVGDCGAGYCVEEGERLVNVNPTPGATTMVTPRVRRGALPFRILGIPEKSAEDGYKSKLYYAVTENLAVTTTYRKDAGGISIVDAAGTSMVTPASSAHFVAFSPGQDKRGAFTRFGGQQNACADPDTVGDAINCHTGSGAPHNRAIYRFSEQSKVGAGLSHYDDYMKYYASVETPLWRVGDAGGFNIVDLIDIAGGDRIGVSISAPVATLDIAGNVQVSDNLFVRDLCSVADGDCFRAESIGGDDPELQCDNPAKSDYDAGRPYMSGISAGRAECVSAASLEARCPTGQIMSGISAAGVPECTSVTGCAPRTVNLCQIAGVWETDVLPSGLSGQTYTTPVSGVSFRRNYTCTGGNWVNGSPATTGSCTCNAVNNQLENLSCHPYMPGSGIASSWTGQATRYRTTVCPAGTTTYSAVDTTNCICQPTTDTRTRTCAQLGYSGHTGTGATQTRTWTCSNAKNGSWVGGSGNWTTDNATLNCTCTPNTFEQRFSCPSGYTGSGTLRTRDFLCPSGTYTGWVDVPGENDCTCNAATPPQTDNIACPPGEVGSIDRERHWNCAASPPAWGVWAEVNNNCGPVTYQWKPKTTSSGTGSSPLGNSVGGVCSTEGAQSPCSTPSGSGYTYYDACRCE